MTARPTRRCRHCRTQGANRLTGYHRQCRRTGSLVPAKLPQRGVSRHAGGVVEYRTGLLSGLLTDTGTATLDAGDRNHRRGVDLDAIADEHLLSIAGRKPADDLYAERDAARVEAAETGRRERVLALIDPEGAFALT